MEGGRGRVLLMVGLMLVMLVGQSAGLVFMDCYPQCRDSCAFISKSALFCHLKCIEKCFLIGEDQTEADGYCELSCVMKACASVNMEDTNGNFLLLLC